MYPLTFKHLKRVLVVRSKIGLVVTAFALLFEGRV